MLGRLARHAARPLDGSSARHEPFLHPGRAARILVAGEPAGWLGEIHPLVAAEWELRDTVAAFELDLDAVPEPHDRALPRG